MVDSESLFSKIKKYKLNPIEARAWKIGIMYLILLEKTFPIYAKQKNIYSGDPRKHFLFKVCYKLVTEKSEELKDHDLKAYIKAQLEIIKLNRSEESYLTPSILAGDPAWNRWLVWKKKMDGASIQQSVQDVGIKIDLDKVIKELKETRTFLTKRLKSFSKEELLKAHKDRTIMRWIAQGFVSPYFLAICPLLNQNNEDLLEKFSFDVKKYQFSNDKNVFEENFPEFK